ncbi:hypothetical protein RB628_30305 [Streptomyces sp. ADMS]|uniref:hypothetical protein n=1 Tax=Streptomyces sp. ADMS TaxID=3071415 RepID=UPI00296F96E1|nr:hypothetical protein [Streptomyces sp. ADMS]MDW4909517.1 hypothetical protein [Streptomyces sp. ADMS]
MADYTQPDVVPKRVRFFDGQFLQDQDFIDEQRFHLDRERRQSRLLRLTGVSTGLTVTSDEPSRITVTRGMAVDSLGRHLVLAADTTLPLGEGFEDRQGIEVHLAYREAATDVAQTGGASARRWDESPRIVVVAPDGTTTVAPDDAPPDLVGPTVLLARLAVAENGEVTVDLTATQRSTLSVAGALGIGTTAPGSDLEIGDYGPRDRHLTFKVAGGDGHRGGIHLRAGSEDENEGYSLEYDRRPVAGQGLHVRTHGPDDPEDGTTRLFVAPGGDVGIGTTTPDNQGGWDRVLDVVGAGRTKLSVRTATVEGRVVAHDVGVFGAKPGLVVGTESASPLTLATGGAARLSVTADGHVGVGTTSPDGTGEWGRVVDVLGVGSTKLSVRTAKVDGRVVAQDTGVFGAAAGMAVGTASASALTFVTNQAGRLTIAASGNVGIGTYNPTSRLTVSAEDNHLQLRRERIQPDEDNKYVFLELYQDDSGPATFPAASFNIRFKHHGYYQHRIEAGRWGFHFKHGDLQDDTYRDIYAARVTATELAIGAVTIGEAELNVLKRLAAGQLNVEVFSPRLAKYAYASDVTLSDNRNHVLAHANPSSGYSRWVLKPMASQ